MNGESYSKGMNGLISGRETGSRGTKTRTAPAPWEGDWRLAIAEERVATAQAKLAAAELRVRELIASASH